MGCNVRLTLGKGLSILQKTFLTFLFLNVFHIVFVQHKKRRPTVNKLIWF